MSDAKFSEHVQNLICKHEACISKAQDIETKILNKENKALGIATIVGFIVYIIPKLIEMVI